MAPFDRYAAPGRVSRTAVIAAGVVLFHVAALWALQSGLARKPVEIIVPAEVIAQIMAPPAPQVQPPPPAPPPPTPPPPRPAVVKKTAPRPAPVPLAVADPTPAPVNAPLVAPAEPTPDPAPPAPVAAPAPVVAAAPAPPAPPAPPRIELPSSNAAYLNNPAPSYPSISRRMGEQGKVVLRVLISTEGLPEKIEIRQSSGYDRLDRHAQETVLRWRFVPGKRNGVAEAMWNLVPINFVLE